VRKVLNEVLAIKGEGQMFNSFKKAMADARLEANEAQETIKAQEEERLAQLDRSFERLFEHIPGTDRWEFCILVFMKNPHLPKGGMFTIQFVGPNGERFARDLSEGPKSEWPDALEVVARLGQAGWEIYSEEHDTTILDEDNLINDLKNLSKHITTSDTYRLKRRITETGHRSLRPDEVI
jgi:hypothetical protein